MTTEELCYAIKLKAPNWDYEGSRSILQQLNHAQNFIFSRPFDRSVYVDRTTGDFPYLVTEAEKYDYDIPNVNVTVEGVVRSLRIFKVIDVFSDNSNSSDYGVSTLQANTSLVDSDIIHYRFNGNPATETEPASVIFGFDPGAQATLYRIKALIEPLQLTAVAIPLMLPKTAENMLIEGALAYIEFFDYGRSDRMVNFEEKLVPKFLRSNIVPTPRGSRGAFRRKF